MQVGHPPPRDGLAVPAEGDVEKGLLDQLADVPGRVVAVNRADAGDVLLAADGVGGPDGPGPPSSTRLESAKAWGDELGRGALGSG